MGRNNKKHVEVSWLPPDTAPKDGSTFIGVIENNPTPVVCAWSGASGKWVYADLQCGMFNGEWNDHYFENDWVYENSLIAWMLLPNI